MVTLRNNHSNYATVTVNSAGDTVQLWSGVTTVLTVLGAQITLGYAPDAVQVKALVPESRAPVTWNLPIEADGTVGGSLETLVGDARVALNGHL